VDEIAETKTSSGVFIAGVDSSLPIRVGLRWTYFTVTSSPNRSTPTSSQERHSAPILKQVNHILPFVARECCLACNQKIRGSFAVPVYRKRPAPDRM
jgi:hypothetical protein